MDPKILVIVGGPGSGKTATARAVAKRWPLSFHLETDRLREDMIVNGFVLPDTTLEGDAIFTPAVVDQFRVVRRTSTFIAKDWADHGYFVAVDGPPIPPKTFADDYLELFADPRVTRVLLRPGGAVQVARMLNRAGPFDAMLSGFGADFWDENMKDTPTLGWNVINNASMSIEETVDAVVALMSDS